ncbi:MAG: PAS domain S-box protein [Pirellulales bacterium]
MINFWSHLFDTSDFPSRWNCGDWTAGHGWLHILSDLGVWSAYFAIPCVLLYFSVRRKDLPFRRIFFLFGAFILLCGLTHLMEAAIFWWPAYRLAGVVKLLTAAVSWVTVLALVRVAPRALSMRSPEELEREITARKQTEYELQRLNLDLERRVEERTSDLASANAYLRHERDRFSTTLASIGDAVITTDTEGRITMLNRVAQFLTGWTNEDAKGHPLTDVFDIVNEKSRQPVDNPAMRALQEGVIIGLANHTVLIAKDGVERFIDDSAAPIQDADGITQGAVLVFRDISEKYQAEAKLRESEARFVQLADAISQLAWMARPDGYIDWFNSRWYDYTGTTFEQMEGLGWQSVHDPEILPEVLKRWRGSLKSGQPFDMVFPLRGADGTFRPFLTRMVPYRDEQGNIVRWFGTNTDISEQKQIQQELRDVAARLSEADHRKDEFLATLAHELRNPLAPIRTGLEVMKHATDDPARMEAVRGTMERQMRQLVMLVDDLLDISRITRGKLQLRKSRVDLKEVVQTAVETAQPVIDEAGHELTVSLPETVVRLHADPHRMAQIISNLLTNAAKYTPAGGRVALTAECDAGHLTVTVEDNGIGIPAEKLEEIFEMFGQVDHPMQQSASGLGIGLTLVRSLIEMHDGTIEVHSPGTGQGSRFVVRLPLSDEAEGGEAPPPQGGMAPVDKPCRVLVVDDNIAAASMLAMAVEMFGHQTRTANDGKEAVDVAAEFLPDVVLMDIGMPIMNGYEAAQQIRRQPRGEEIILVALTGWGQDEDKQRSKSAGFDHHLVKPADPSELQKLLADATPLTDPK